MSLADLKGEVEAAELPLERIVVRPSASEGEDDAELVLGKCAAGRKRWSPWSRTCAACGGTRGQLHPDERIRRHVAVTALPSIPRPSAKATAFASR